VGQERLGLQTNLKRVDPSWLLTRADSSAGMLKMASDSLGTRAECVLAGAEALPLPDAAFAVVGLRAEKNDGGGLRHRPGTNCWPR
jgi:hypothetical protein